MPRLSCNYRQFLNIITAHGFVQLPPKPGSHRAYRATINGEARLVIVSGHSPHDDIRPGTLKAMIRQCGLPEHLFRK